MAQTATIALTDDCTGEEGAQTRTIVLGRERYDVDLTDENWERVKADMQFILKFARRVENPSRAPRNRSAAALAEPSIIREWAKKRGIPVGKRGRLPRAVVQAYHTR